MAKIRFLLSAALMFSVATLACSSAAAPCSVSAAKYRTPDMPAMVVYLVALTGPCRDARVRVQFASSIGGVYPPQPVVLSATHRRYLHPGNPEWWYPVKITAKGPVRIAVKEGQ